MSKTELPTTGFRIKSTAKGRVIFDPIRRKFVSLTPEELVRQGVVEFLLSRKRIPKSLISIEKELLVARTRKRYDIVVYRSDGSIFLIVECKAPKIAIDQQVFDQIARYNLTAHASYLMVSNGVQNLFCTIDYTAGNYKFIADLPEFEPCA